MTRTATTALLALLLLALSGAAPAGARDEKPSEIKMIMEKANKPGSGLYFRIAQELRAEDTDWKEVARDAQELKRLTAELPKLTPPKGDKASWAQLTRAYAANAAALDEAAKKKNKPAARAAHARMGEDACTACHKVHRED